MEAGSCRPGTVLARGLPWQNVCNQFYAVMLQGAEDSDFSYLAEALLRHTLDSRERPESRIRKNFIREGMLHLELSNLLKARQENGEAEKEAQIAATLLETAAHAYPEDYRIFGTLRPVENELQHEEAERALAALKGMRALIERSQYKELALNYYRLLGDVHFRLRHLDEAASSFESAIEIADAALESLKNTDDRLSWKRATEESYRGECAASSWRRKKSGRLWNAGSSIRVGRYYKPPCQEIYVRLLMRQETKDRTRVQFCCSDLQQEYV